jgi:transposase InsO family protein
MRFAIVGPLLAAPPARGELRAALARLSEQSWRHPMTGEPVRFGVSTIERWFYAARNERRDPVARLRRRPRRDAGRPRRLSERLRLALQAQYRDHPSWSFKLHADNLAARAAEDSTLGPPPGYATVRRFLKARGWLRQRRRRSPDTPGAAEAASRLVRWEVRSYEAEYVHGLWHLDFHHGSRKVVTRDGAWRTPRLLGVLDDRSRLACHLQWYLDETAETLVHGLSQAIQKRALPRSLMTDNGSAMLAAEVVQGFVDLGIVHETTLPYSPYQNAKQEVFWATAEGRLLPMLEGVEELTLALLNEATQAWVEMEYNRAVHSELGGSPLARYLAGPEVGRDSPTSDALRRAFRAAATRTQRRSDGTLSVAGRRFEVPGRYRHLERLHLRYARWDLRSVDLVDPRSGALLCTLYPLDKTRNADGFRRPLDPLPEAPAGPAGPATSTSPIAPLLRRLMAEYAATGLPPAYLPCTDDPEEPNP